MAGTQKQTVNSLFIRRLFSGLIKTLFLCWYKLIVFEIGTRTCQ